MLHLDTELRRSERGVGLSSFAIAEIPRGTLIYVAEPTDVHRESPKSIRHSCRPNTMLTAWGFLMAVTDIHAGDEITNEHGLSSANERMPCLCGSSLCRGSVQRTDRDNYFVFWDEIIEAALCFADVVDQPLWSRLDVSTQSVLVRFFTRAAPYRSVRELGT